MIFTRRDETDRDETRWRCPGNGIRGRRILGLLGIVLVLAFGGAPAAAQGSPFPVQVQQGEGVQNWTPSAGWMPTAVLKSAVRLGRRAPAAVGSSLWGRSEGARLSSPVQSAAEGGPATSDASGLFSSMWCLLALGVGIGASVFGLLYWLRAQRMRRRMEARVEELQSEKQQAEEAYEEAYEQVDKLEEISEAKSRFLKELSHAFRTPLTLTLGPIDNLLEGKHGALNEEVQTQLRLAQRNGTRLLWLVNQLLDLAELETGSMALEPAEDNFVQFVAKGVWSFEGLAERRDIRLGLEASLNDPMLWFDESKMERILANLISGAFRSVEQGGAIRVRVRPVQDNGTSDQVELVVEGNGAELASGQQETYGLDRVSRGDDSWESGDVSTEIGLYLVEELVDLHDGYVQVKEQGEERIQFIVRLPRRPAGVEEAEGPQDESVPPALGREDPGALTLSRKALSLELKRDKPTPPVVSADESPAQPGSGETPDQEDQTTVLVIDDNPVVCTLVRSHLEPEYRVEEAHEGVAGYNMATTLLPDLVIADVMMPEMDGFELCRKIKEDPDVDHIPVIFLTARADLEDKIEGLDVGADAYLTKPFEPEELIAHVENLIASRRSLRESFREETGSETRGSANGREYNVEGVENAEEALPATAEGKSLKERIEETIADNLTDPDFGVSDLAGATALSSSQLRRRMKEMYDCTPVQLIRRRRLEAGAELLTERPDATIGEVAYAVGFNSQSYFSRSFRDEFGTSPSRYRSQHEGAGM